MPLIPAIAALAILLGGGSTLAVSQNSGPGDVLFPVKLFSENVRVATTIGDKRQNDLRLDIAAERVKEIESAAIEFSKGPQNENGAEGIKKAINNLNTHLNDVSEDVDSLIKSNDFNDAEDINSSLLVRAAAFKRLFDDASLSASGEVRSKIEAEAGVLDDMSFKIATQTMRIDSDERSSQSGKDLTRYAQDKIASAQEKISNIESRITREQSVLPSNIIASARQSLDEAKNMLSLAKSDNSAGNFESAAEKAKQAKRLASKANSIISIAQNSSASAALIVAGLDDNSLFDIRREDRRIDINDGFDDSDFRNGSSSADDSGRNSNGSIDDNDPLDVRQQDRQEDRRVDVNDAPDDSDSRTSSPAADDSGRNGSGSVDDNSSGGGSGRGRGSND